MARIAGKRKPQRLLAKYTELILAGTDEEAEEILRQLPGYEPIPEINMMTIRMVIRLSGVRGIEDHSMYNTGANYGINKYAVKGRWGTGAESQGDIISISWHMKHAGWDITPSEGMKFIGVRIGQNIFNLYPSRAVLALLYANLHTRYKVQGAVEEHYDLFQDSVQPAAAELLPAEMESTPPISTGFTPEFVTELVRVCVRESVTALLQCQQVQGNRANT